MDLHLIPDALPSVAERAAVDAVLGLPETGWEGAEQRSAFEGHVGRGGREARARRHLLLPALHAVQQRAGSISPGALNYVCQRLGVPPAEAYGVASFYALFSLEPRPPVEVHVCDDIVCRVNGAAALTRELERRIGPAGEPTLEGKASWRRSPCLGLCERAPGALALQTGEEPRDRVLAPATSGLVLAALEQPTRPPDPEHRGRSGSAAAPQTLGQDQAQLRLLRRVGRVDPTSLDDYRANGGYAALRQAFHLGPEGVVREVLDARLTGRGGAAFPTGRKWQDVARAPVRPHYLVCNADESEPGTFKDRVLMEEDPFALVEAMTIAGYATGCARGYLYLRGEYPLALERMQHAVAEARNRGFLGDDLMGEGVHFDIEIRRGAGAYVCGEETALFNSLEGLRGEPRNKPPYPVQAGLFGKPTLVNNVETLVNVLDIVLQGGLAFAAIGTEHSTGTKLFCVSGCVARPGVYELPFGTTLRQALTLAGGIRGGRPLQAVLLGGAAGSFLTPAELDVPLSIEGTRAIGAALGSGAAMVFDDTVDLTDVVLRIAAFFRDESCGQCVPCRVGTVRQEEAVRRLAAGAPLGSVASEIALLDDIAQAMADASICGLGQTASSAVQSAIHKLRLFDRKEAR
ncbi:MAG: NAD(P)H-dependent oxidoreductase subunit E [Chloroflexi bacterium]|nr:NAD(P)H-dependent oxidoreductase subunit E [Chloroflexota bacterium]